MNNENQAISMFEEQNAHMVNYYEEHPTLSKKRVARNSTVRGSGMNEIMPRRSKRLESKHKALPLQYDN
jgi:hypothetical protein